MALTADRNTPYRNGDTISAPVAASTVIYAGALVCADASGNAVPGATATTLTYLGRASEHVDNSAGSAGDVSIAIDHGKAFAFKNSGADAVTQVSLGKPCYIVDDETVAATDGTSSRSAAGKVIGIDSEGVWVL